MIYDFLGTTHTFSCSEEKEVAPTKSTKAKKNEWGQRRWTPRSSRLRVKRSLPSVVSVSKQARDMRIDKCAKKRQVRHVAVALLDQRSFRGKRCLSHLLDRIPVPISGVREVSAWLHVSAAGNQLAIFCRENTGEDGGEVQGRAPCPIFCLVYFISGTEKQGR
jgi:hypothetical protein